MLKIKLNEFSFYDKNLKRNNISNPFISCQYIAIYFDSTLDDLINIYSVIQIFPISFIFKRIQFSGYFVGQIYPNGMIFYIPFRNFCTVYRTRQNQILFCYIYLYSQVWKNALFIHAVLLRKNWWYIHLTSLSLIPFYQSTINQAADAALLWSSDEQTSLSSSSWQGKI